MTPAWQITSKGVSLAKFGEKHVALFGHIQHIRKRFSVGGEHYARLEINKRATIQALVLITGNPPLDALFANVAGYSEGEGVKYCASLQLTVRSSLSLRSGSATMNLRLRSYRINYE